MKHTNFYEAFLIKARGRKIAKRIIAVMSVFVLLVTIDQLKFVAVTLESASTCGYEAHVHDAACYDDIGQLICGKEEHVHGIDCAMEAADEVVAETLDDSTEPEEIVAENVEPEGEELPDYQMGDVVYAPEDEVIAKDAPEETEDAPEGYVVSDQYPFYLSDVIARQGLDIAMDDVVKVGQVYEDEDELVLSCEAVEGDFACFVLSDFVRIELGITLRDGEVVPVELLYGIAPMGGTDDEADAEPVIEPAEAQIAEPVVEPIGEQSVETVDEPAEEQTVETVDEPVEEQTVETVDEPAEEQSAETVDEPAEEQSAETVDEPTEEETDETTVELNEEPVEETAEEPAEEEADGSAQEESDEIAEELADETVEEPSDEPSDEPAMEAATEPTGEETDEPAEEKVDEPAEEPAAEPVKEELSDESGIEESDEGSADEPVKEQDDESMEETSDEPAGESTEKADEEAADEPAEEPSDEMIEEPVVEPDGESADEPGEEAAEEPAAEPVIEENIVGRLTIDFAGFDVKAIGETGFMTVDGEDGSVSAPLDALVERGVECGLAVTGAELLDAEMTYGDSADADAPVSYVDGTLIIRGDGELTLTGENGALAISVAGFAMPTASAEGEGVTVEAVNDNLLPGGASAHMAGRISSGEGDALIDDLKAYLSAGSIAEGRPRKAVKAARAKVATAAESQTCYAVFDVSVLDAEENPITETGAVEVTLRPGISLYEALPENIRDVRVSETALYHYHDGEYEDAAMLGLDYDEESGVIRELRFETHSFSEWVLRYTVEYTTVENQVDVSIDFTDIVNNGVDFDESALLSAFDAGVAIDLAELERGYAEAGDGMAEGALSVTYEAVDAGESLTGWAAMEAVSADAGLEVADGQLRVTADGEVALSDGETTVIIAISGYSDVVARLKSGFATIEDAEGGHLPINASASAAVVEGLDAIDLVKQTYGEQAHEAYTVFAIDTDAKSENGFRVTLDLEQYDIAGRDFQLYHVHDGAVEPLDVTVSAVTDENGLEQVNAIAFETPDFSDFVLGYTVDFAYVDEDGIVHTWKFPGTGSYKLADVLDALEIDFEEITDADLELFEVVGDEPVSEAALYLGVDEDGDITINSDEAFNDVYALTVVADGRSYAITVTDEQMLPVTINLLDYNGIGAATGEELSLVSGKSYGVIAVLKDDAGNVVGYNKTKTGAEFSDGATATCQIGLESFRPLEWKDTWWQEGNEGSIDRTKYNVEYRLYEGSFAKDQWQHKGYGDIVALPDSVTGFEFLEAPNGNVVTESGVTMNLKRAYDKRYNIRFNVEPAGLSITDADQVYALVTVEHQTTGNTYGWAKVTIAEGQSVVDFPITTWYDANNNVRSNEKFTGNENVTVELFTTNAKSDGSKDGFSTINDFRGSQVKVKVAEGSSINKYNLYYDGGRVSEDDDVNHITNYYDNLSWHAPNGTISKGDLDALLDDATDFGYYTLKYIGHSGDIEATIGADYMDTIFQSEFGYSGANVNVNRLKVLKIYTDNAGNPVSKQVTIRLKQDDKVVVEKTGTTGADGRLELEFDGLNSGDYDIEEVIDGQVVSGKGSAQINGQTIYYNFSIDKAHFANNKNVNYFGTIGDNQDLDKLKTMLQKASRVDVVILTDTEADKARIEAAEAAQDLGKNIDVVINGTEPYKKYDIKNDFVKLRQLSDDLASAKSSSTVHIINIKASQISENGLYIDDDNRYVVLNIEMDGDDNQFCPMVYLGGQLLEADYGQSGKSNSAYVLYNLRKDGKRYTGEVNTSKQGAGVILAPDANAHILGGPFGGTIITEKVDRMGNELHSNNPNQIQTLNAVIQNVIGAPTMGSLELRKEFSNTSIKDKITYFTFEVQLDNADMTKVANKSFPASGLKKGDSVTFNESGVARVLVRAGNSVTIANLPAGTTFTVKEITTPETAHFTLDHYEVNGNRSSTGTIVAGDTAKAKVLNNIRKADLTIEKVVQGTTDDSKEFEFTLALENKTSEEGQAETWEQYPDKYKISIAGGEYVEVDGSKNATYTFKLKAGERAELQDLADDNRVIRYTVTETAVFVDGVRHKIKSDNQPVMGYSNSALVVQANYTQGDHVVFTNNYSAAAKAQIVAHKVMQGRDLAAEEFSFELREGSPTGTVVGKAVKNAADGKVTFDEISYTTADLADTGVVDGKRTKEYTYYICEVVPEPADPGIAYAEPVQVTVTVVDDGKGNMTATVNTPDAADIQIVNTLKTQQTLRGTKTLVGRDMEAGEEFRFIVKEGEKEVAIGTVTGGVNGVAEEIDFTPIEYRYDPTTTTYPVVHEYTIVEDTTALPANVTHDPAQTFTATVTVSYDAENHRLVAGDPVYSPDPVAFTNTYDNPDKTSVKVRKEWVDGTGDKATLYLMRYTKDEETAGGETQEETNSGSNNTWKLNNFYNHEKPSYAEGVLRFPVDTTVTATIEFDNAYWTRNFKVTYNGKDLSHNNEPLYNGTEPCGRSETFSFTVKDGGELILYIELNEGEAIPTPQFSKETASIEAPLQLAFNPFAAQAEDGSLEVDVRGLAHTIFDGYTRDESFVKVITLSNGNWEKTIGNLDATDEQGHKYYYAIAEGEMDGYTVTYDHDVPVEAGSLVTLTATNTATTPQTTALRFSKKWLRDGAEVDWPSGAHITVQLYGQKGAGEFLTSSSNISANTVEVWPGMGETSLALTNKPDGTAFATAKVAYDGTNKQFVISGLPTGWTYHVKEEQVSGWLSPRYQTGNETTEGAYDGGTIINEAVNIALPATGGPGTTRYTAAGLALVMLAAALLLRKRRDRE